MDQIKLLTKIAKAMLEFTNEKERSKSFPGQSILIHFINTKKRNRNTLFDEFDIDELVNNLLNSEVEYSAQIKINKYLYDILHGADMMSNSFYRNVNFNGEEFVEKVKLLINTTHLTVEGATKMLLEIYHAEAMKDAFNFIRKVKKAVDTKSK